MLGSGFVPNWWTLAILRVPLGAFEGILFPGCIFLISSWYPRYETQKRISAFYLGGQFVSGFGNIIAYGFSYVPSLPLDGLHVLIIKPSSSGRWTGRMVLDLRMSPCARFVQG